MCWFCELLVYFYNFNILLRDVNVLYPASSRLPKEGDILGRLAVHQRPKNHP